MPRKQKGAARLKSKLREAYAHHRADGMNKSAAARAARFSPKGAGQTAHALERDREDVRDRIAFLREAKTSVMPGDMEVDQMFRAAEAEGQPIERFSVDWITLELLRNARLATAAGDIRGANNALECIGDIRGHYPKRPASLRHIYNDFI